ncbi:YlaI family protein [Bacillus sp. 1NLA3E]|uniref:YlaI family protein n=1 Tax=Bacillus sp. 1NLA3E TaxID=666686 RepID=UPI000247F0AD|nr:YlaI family protein [Bacillus sp. 1NLA3E]AGK52929.1 YlaI-like protein [Bacillus sp. 1NLA3E]
MRVKCFLCDKIESIGDDSPLAKRLRNRPIHTYMCNSCEERITEKTNTRIASGNFRLYRQASEDDNW